jgi:xylem cysteine proteinase
LHLDLSSTARSSPKEKVKRYEVFKQSLMHIAETNRKNGSYWLGLNQFAAMSHEEFKANHLGLKPGLSKTGTQSQDRTTFRYVSVVNLRWAVKWR